MGLLKKSIKKADQRKKSAKRKWDERSGQTEARKEKRQKKRADNIAGRKKDVKAAKMKKAAKRGRMVPGFK